MARTPHARLKLIGLDAAREVIGEGRAQDLEVTDTRDSSDQPAYFFSFLMQQDRDRQVAAMLRTRLAQRIRDKLVSLGDAHYPFIRILDRDDWSGRLSA